MYKAAHRKHTRNNYDLQADLERIRSAFADTASDVRGKTGEMLSQSVGNIRDKSAEVRDNVADYTADQPFKSLGIALLIGFLLGYFVHK